MYVISHRPIKGREIRQQSKLVDVLSIDSEPQSCGKCGLLLTPCIHILDNSSCISLAPGLRD